MVKVVKILSPYSIMLDVGGAILTVHSMRPDETELNFGGIERDVSVGGNLTEQRKIEGNNVFIRYTSTRTDGGSPELERRTCLESMQPQG